MLEAADHVERRVRGHRQPEMLDVADDDAGGQSFPPQTCIAIVDGMTVQIAAADIVAPLRKLDQQASGSAGRLEDAAHRSTGMPVETAEQELELGIRRRPEDDVVVLRVIEEPALDRLQGVSRL